MKKHITDILNLLFGSIFVITYNYSENLSPRGLILVIQLLSLWFLLRIISFFFPKIINLFITTLIGWGFIEAIWGLGQLYNILPSGHNLFKITGSFFNPGPYGGFIAIILPFTLHYLLVKNQKKIIQYPLLLVVTLCILILPATLSRSAWIACLLGCIIIITERYHIKYQLNKLKQYSKKIILPSIFSISIFLISLGYIGYDLKKDSADGRIFIWKISLLAIKKSPIITDGLGSFPKNYADAQIAYFKQDLATENEKKIAGSPEYTFNEYLRIFIEQGFIGLFLFLLILINIIQKGIQNNQLGATAGFISLCIFAFSSYPYYLWQFLLIWILLGIICLHKKEEKKLINNKYQKYLTLSIFTLLLVIFGYTSMLQYHFYKSEKKWKNLSYLYLTKIYDYDLQKKYQNLYPILKSNPRFVFEYSSILNTLKQYKKANECIERGILLSCDPMFYNLQGRNYHQMKNYIKAEKSLLTSINLLPKRIYPYFLLTKLYADTLNYQPEKMKWAAYKVFKESPKVKSQAIDEMRKEVEFILKEKAP